MINMSGFGRKSIDKLIDSIEKSRSVELNRFIAALSIPGVGDSTAKDISKHCEYDFDTFVLKLIDKYNWSVIDGIGEKLVNRSMNGLMTVVIEKILENYYKPLFR